jgi:hypothetical protein
VRSALPPWRSRRVRWTVSAAATARAGNDVDVSGQRRSVSTHDGVAPHRARQTDDSPVYAAALLGPLLLLWGAAER